MGPPAVVSGSIGDGELEGERGSVDVDETPGGGATFRVNLPLAPAHSDLPAGSQAEFSDSTEAGSHG